MSDMSMSPDLQRVLDLLHRHFLCRTDRVTFFAPWGKPQPIDTDGQLDALLAAHLEGERAPAVPIQYQNARGEASVTGRFRIGSYTPTPTGTTRWLCLDFDGEGHADALADPERTARGASRAFADAGLPCYLERSGGGHGWHLWVFFDPPLPAAKARALAEALAPGEVTLATGEIVPNTTGRGIEVFPKQDHIQEDGCGASVWLPWWSGAEGAANQFHRPDADGSLVPYLPTEFATVEEATVDALLAARGKASACTTAGAEQRSNPPGPVWQEWRREALTALALESVYGQWLTDNRRPGGWLECHDPWSPTGDRDPSAGVADGSGEAERGVFHSFISGQSLSVFDFLIERGLAADFREARRRIADLASVPLPASRLASGPSRGNPGQPVRPQIQVNNRQLRDIIADAWDAVHAANQPPALFRRSGGLVRLVCDEQAPRIETADENAAYATLIRAADWVKVTGSGISNVPPVRNVARDMLAVPDPALPLLEAVVTAPIFGRNSELLATPGYHQHDRVWLRPLAGLGDLHIPSQPSQQDVAAARSLVLDDLLVDFPFVDEGSRAHAVAALLLPPVRRMIAGCTPIHLFAAPAEGTGKGLLCNLISIATTGTECSGRTLALDEDEARKMITAELVKGRPIILLDNNKQGRTLGCAALASVITSDTWTDRLLGRTETVTVPNRALWLLTGNNPRLSMEIARRCVRIRMDAGMDRAWRRKQFKHKHIIAWAKQRRRDLLRATLLLTQAWIAAGQPRYPTLLGSFEEWSALMGGILSVAGIPGFLGSLEDLYQEADVEGEMWREFVTVWWETHGDQPRRPAELLDLCQRHELMLPVLGDGLPRSQQTRLGLALHGARDRVLRGVRVVLIPDPRRKGQLYALRPVEHRQPGGSDDAPVAEPAGPMPDLDGEGSAPKK